VFKNTLLLIDRFVFVPVARWGTAWVTSQVWYIAPSSTSTYCGKEIKFLIVASATFHTPGCHYNFATVRLLFLAFVFTVRRSAQKLHMAVSYDRHQLQAYVRSRVWPMESPVFISSFHVSPPGGRVAQTWYGTQQGSLPSPFLLSPFCLPFSRGFRKMHLSHQCLFV